MSFAEQMISLELHPRTLYITAVLQDRNQIQNYTVWQYVRKVAQNIINYLEPEIVQRTKKSHDAFSESWESTCFHDNVF